MNIKDSKTVTLTVMEWAAIVNALESWDSTFGNVALRNIFEQTGLK